MLSKKLDIAQVNLEDAVKQAEATLSKAEATEDAVADRFNDLQTHEERLMDSLTNRLNAFEASITRQVE